MSKPEIVAILAACMDGRGRNRQRRDQYCERPQQAIDKPSPSHHGSAITNGRAVKIAVHGEREMERRSKAVMRAAAAGLGSSSTSLKRASFVDQ